MAKWHRFILQGQTKEIICQCTGEEMVVLNAEQMSEMQLKKRLIPRRKQVCWRILVRVWRMITYLVWQRNRKLSTLPVLSLQSCSKSTYHGPFTLWNTTTTPNSLRWLIHVINSDDNKLTIGWLFHLKTIIKPINQELVLDWRAYIELWTHTRQAWELLEGCSDNSFYVSFVPLKTSRVHL